MSWIWILFILLYCLVRPFFTDMLISLSFPNGAHTDSEILTQGLLSGVVAVVLAVLAFGLARKLTSRLEARQAEQKAINKYKSTPQSTRNIIIARIPSYVVEYCKKECSHPDLLENKLKSYVNQGVLTWEEYAALVSEYIFHFPAPVLKKAPVQHAPDSSKHAPITNPKAPKKKTFSDMMMDKIKIG